MQMARRWTVIALACFLLPASLSAGTADEARTAALADLEATRDAFLKSIDGLSEAQWNWKPAPDRWSVAECAEHITRAESFLLDLMRGALTEPLAADALAKSHGKEEAIRTTILDRTQKFQAPEPINPMQSGEVRNRQQIQEDFGFSRGRTYEFTSSVDDLTAHGAMNPAVGELDLSGWVTFLSGHTARHTLQLEEVKASEGFPKE